MEMKNVNGLKPVQAKKTVGETWKEKQIEVQDLVVGSARLSRKSVLKLIQQKKTRKR